MRLRAIVIVFILALATISCHSWGTRSEVLSSRGDLIQVGYWNSFVGIEVNFFSDGRAILRTGPHRAKVERLSSRELFRLKGLLASAEFREFREALESSGYRPSCCDVKEVVFSIQGEVFGYPACDYEIPADLRHVIDVANSILADHFGGRFAIPIGPCKRPAPLQ